MKRVKDVTTIASKISQSDKKKLHAIADELGITFYGMVQAFLCTVVRYWDKGSMISTEHRTLIEAFSNVLGSIVGSHNPLSRRNVKTEKIKGAILLIERQADKRPQLMEITKNEQGNIIESYNYDTMLASFLGAVDPNALQRLEDEAKELGYFSITQTLHELIMQRSTPRTDLINMEVRELFEDVRIATGHQINNDIHYKQGYRKNVAEYTTIQQKQTYRADVSQAEKISLNDIQESK